MARHCTGSELDHFEAACMVRGSDYTDATRVVLKDLTRALKDLPQHKQVVAVTIRYDFEPEGVEVVGEMVTA
ncbi:MAG: hypothetical protein ACXVGB_00075 [Mycobacteriaceae bacterium]